MQPKCKATSSRPQGKSTGTFTKSASRTQHFSSPKDLIFSCHADKLSKNHIKFFKFIIQLEVAELSPVIFLFLEVIDPPKYYLNKHTSVHHQDMVNTRTDFSCHWDSPLMVLWSYQNLFEKVLAAAQAVEICSLPGSNLFGIREQVHHGSLCIQLLRWP